VQFGYFILDEIQRLFGLSPRYTDPSRIYQNQLRLLFTIYLFANIITWYWLQSTAFVYWILLNIFVFLLFYTDFFEGKFRKHRNRKSERRDNDKTFFEDITKSIGKIANGKQEKPKEVKKEAKEVYELKREDTKSLKKLQTQYFKEFSPHSNRLQALNGAVPVSTFSPYLDEPLEKEIEYTKEENIRPLAHLGRKNKVLSKISEAKSESSESVSEELEKEKPVSPLIKVREIKSEYRQMQQRQKEMVAQYEDFLLKSAEDFKKQQQQKQKESSLLNNKNPSSPTKTSTLEKSAETSNATTGKSVLGGLSGTTPLTNTQNLSSQSQKPLIGGDTQAKPSETAPKTSMFGGATTGPETAKPQGGLFNSGSSLTSGGTTGGGLLSKPVEQKAETKPTGGLFGNMTAPATGGLFGAGTGGGLLNKSTATTSTQENKPLLSSGTSGATSVFDSTKLGIQTNPSGSIASQISKPLQTGGSTNGQDSVSQSVKNSDQTYRDYFKSKGKIVEEIENLIKNEMAKADVSKVERIPALRPIIDEVRPRLNAQLTNQLDSILESASIILTKFNENANNKVIYYGLIYYITDNILKNCEGYYEKAQKLSIFYRIALILILNNQVPGIVEYMILKIAQEVPVLGGVEPKKAPGMSDTEFLKLKGYKFLSEGTREPYKEYDKRMNALPYFFFMLLTLRLEDVLEDTPDEEKSPELMRTAMKVLRSKLSYEWMYWSFIKFYVKLPVELNSVHILIGFYYSSAFTIKKQPAQVCQLMKLLWSKMIPQLEKLGPNIQGSAEKNDFIENKMVFLKGKLKKFHENDRNGMQILNPIQEAKLDELKVEEDEGGNKNKDF